MSSSPPRQLLLISITLPAVSVTLPGSTSYIQDPPHPLLFQQRHYPALVLLGPALRVSDVHLPHFGCFAVGILVRKTLGCHAKRAGSEDAVNRHTAACTCQSGVSERPASSDKLKSLRNELLVNSYSLHMLYRRRLLIFIRVRQRVLTLTQWHLALSLRLLYDRMERREDFRVYVDDVAFFFLHNKKHDKFKTSPHCMLMCNRVYHLDTRG